LTLAGDHGILLNRHTWPAPVSTIMACMTWAKAAQPGSVLQHFDPGRIFLNLALSRHYV
jgi:hypothetical protein